MVRTMAATAALALLVGCVSPPIVVESAVKTFYTDDFAAAGATFAVSPAAGADATSLEFQGYLESLSNGLAEHGLIAVSEAADADYVVLLSVSVGAAETRITSEPIYGTIGGGTTIVRGRVTGPSGSERFTGTSYTAPRSTVVGTRTVTRTVFTRVLRIDFVAAPAPDAIAPSGAPKVYEGSVTSAGEARDFAVVARCLFDAFFTVFPGDNGAVKTVTAPAAGCVLPTGS